MTMQFAQGQQTATPVDNPVTLVSFPTTLLAPTPVHQTAVLDVRAYNTLIMRVDAAMGGGGTWAVTDVLAVELTYYLDPAGTEISFMDQYYIYATNVGFTGQFRLNDQLYGPYLRISFRDTGISGRTINLTYKAMGSFRILPVPARIMEGPSPTGMLYYNVQPVIPGLGPLVTIPMAYGRGILTVRSGAAGGASLTVYFAGLVTPSESVTAAAANSRASKEFIAPKHQMRAQYENLAGVNQTIEYMVIIER